MSTDTIVTFKNKDAGEPKKPKEPEELLLTFYRNDPFLAKNVTTLNLTKLKNEFSFSKSFNTMLFLRFCESLFDIGTDGWTSYRYFSGSNYEKSVSNISDEAVTNSEFDCTHVSTHIYWNGKNETVYGFICFEKNPFYGALTLAIMVFPGLIWALTQ